MNSTNHAVPVHECFAGVARADPDRLAVVGGALRLTYGQVHQRAQVVAGALRSRGAGPETPVAVLLPRGVAAVVAVLGVWYAGAAYLPLDPEAPGDRLSYLVSDGDPAVVVTSAQLGSRTELSDRAVLELDPDGMCPGRSLCLPADPGRLAYIVYTSGTTGRPKGVLVEHGSLAAMARAHEDVLYSRLPAGPGRVVLNNPLTTDSSFAELVHLAAGRTLYVVDQAERRDPDRMAGFLSRHAIEALDATPTQVRALLLAGQRPALERLKVLILGGEAIDQPLWTALRALPGVTVFNMYGPTECTVDIAGIALAESQVPVIGREWPGCEIFLLDRELRPVPDGSVGELCVAGGQLARGYLHPTAGERDKFAVARLPGRGGPVRLYRTGDRGRRTGAGLLEFLGRADDQVKVHGYRVELGEVEAALRKCTGVLDAAVGYEPAAAANPLRAWVVLAAGTTVAEVRRSLAEILPEHMRPVIAPVTRIPMAGTGKADLRALLAVGPADTGEDAGADHSGEMVGAAWRQILGVPSVTEDEDFFDLGGDSLAAARMTLRLRAETGRPIPVRLIFDHPTFTAYRRAVDRLVHEEVPA